MKKLLTSSILVASVVMASSALADNHSVMGGEVMANAEVASTYLFRGQDLGGVSLSGDLSWMHDSGVYVGAAVVTGDLEKGDKQNYFVGVSRDIGDYNVDVNYTELTYPSWEEKEGVTENPGYGELALSVSRDFAALSVVDNRENDSRYYALDLSGGAFGVTLGTQREENEYNHVQLDYMATDNLTFSVSRAKDSDDDDDLNVDEDTRLVVSYSLPL